MDIGLEDITVVIPYYECFNQVLIVIQNLLESGILEDQIVIVDDHSNDGSFEKLNSKFQHVTFIQNKQNRGAAYCRNVGVTYSFKEYILFIDSDVSFNPSALYALLKGNREYDIVFPKILHYDGTIFTPNDTYTKRYCMCSAVFLIKKEAIYRLDEGFDINYKIYIDDADLFVRCKTFGLKFKYVPDAIFKHPKKMKHSEVRYYLMTRNVIYFSLKIGGIINYKVSMLRYCVGYTLMNFVMALLNRPILFSPLRIQWEGKWCTRPFARGRLIILFLKAIGWNIVKLPVTFRKRYQLKRSLKFD